VGEETPRATSLQSSPGFCYSRLFIGKDPARYCGLAFGPYVEK